MHTTAVVALASGCATSSQTSTQIPQSAAEIAAIGHTAHEAYVQAINSNNVDTFLAALTGDIVYLSPHAPAIVGKGALKAWAAGYLGAYTIHWEKTSDEFIVMGDGAYERYSYKEHDLPKAGGAPLDDVGKGINIYHRDTDGKWRVARDAWSSDLAIPAK